MISDLFNVTAITALVFFLTACTASNSLENTATTNPQIPQKQSPDNRVEGRTRTLNTVMTAEGVECPAVRGTNGALYTVPAMPQTFEAGDKLNIIVADPIVPFASFCQQGQTLDWLRIEWVSASGKILEYWDK